MSTLAFQLLGPPQITLDDEPVNGFVTRKAQALLVYLAATQRVHTRDQIATLFWPDLAEQSAKNNLRRILPNLRKLVGGHLLITHQTVAFNRKASYALDVESFSGALAGSSDATLRAMSLDRLIATTNLYRGEFLQGFHIAGLPAFEEWMLLEREHLRQLVLRALMVLAERYGQAGDAETALATTRRLLTLEPWYEAAHQLQMLLLIQRGERAAALLQYETCRKLLADEFGAEPSAEMTAHYEQLKVGDWGGGSLPLPQPALENIAPPPQTVPTAMAARSVAPVLDCLDMPRRTTFYGRQSDKLELTRRLLVAQMTVIGVLGTGGTGKTALVAQLVNALTDPSAHPIAVAGHQAPFSSIIWRSLINAPALSIVVCSWLQILAGPARALPPTLYEQLDLLFFYLREQRCLLVLDNLESILQEGEAGGHFRDGYGEYEQLLQRMGETDHRSCLLFTSRELPLVLGRLERSYPMVGSYTLKGLDHESGVRLLRAEGLRGSAAELTDLVERYSGIPLALKLVAETIQDLYGGDVAMLLQDRTIIFDDVQTVLNQQFDRLSALEKAILCWLAIEREPVSLQDLAKNWDQPPPHRPFLTAARSLQRRGLLEAATAEVDEPPRSGKHDARFTLQNVVMEYISELLIERMFAELVETADLAAQTNQGPILLRWLNRYSLVKAQSKTYVHDIQIRLLLQPLARRLLDQWGMTNVAHYLCRCLTFLRREQPLTAGYAGTNLLHLLLYLEVDLRGWDFSQLALRQADLRSEALAHTLFQDADFTDAAFINTIDIICAIAVSADGQYLAAGGSDGTIYIWDTMDYQLYCMLNHHKQAITSLAFSDSQFLASSSLDGMICIWEIATKSLLRVFTTGDKSIVAMTLHPDNRHLATAVTDELIYVGDWQQQVVHHRLSAAITISALAFSPDGRLLISVGDQRTIHLWAFPTGELLQTLHGHAGKILAVAFSSQGDKFATGGEDGQIWLWDVATMQLRQVLCGHTDFVLALAFRAGGMQLASGSADQTVRTWNVETGDQQQVFRGHHGWVNGVTYVPSGRALISGGYDQTIRIWQAQNGQLQRLLKGFLSCVDLTGFSADGMWLAACGLDGTVRIWAVATAAVRHSLRGLQAATRDLAFSRNGALLATVGDDYIVRLWDVTHGRLKHTLRGHTAPVRSVTFTPDERYIISGSHDHTLRIWDVATGQLHRSIPQVNATIRSAIAVSPTQSYLAYGTQDSTIEIVDLHTGSRVHTIGIAPTLAVVLTFAAGGRQLACGTDAGQVLVYTVAGADEDDHKGYTLDHQVQVTEAPIWRLLFSPDARLLAWISAGQEIHWLDRETGQVSAAIRTYYGSSCLSFDSAGQTLFTDGPDYTLLMRDTRTGAITGTLCGHTANITSINSSPAGDKIASSSFDGTVRLWDTHNGTCLAVMQAPGPYAGMNVTGVTGISDAQRQALIALGAVDSQLHG